MTKNEKEQAVIAFVAGILAFKGAEDLDQTLDEALACADAIEKKFKGETDGEEEDEVDDEATGEEEDDESEEDEDAGNEADETEDDADEEEDGEEADDEADEEETSKKKPAKKSAPSTVVDGKAGKAKKAPVKTEGKKKFAKKPQVYARDNDTHKEIFSGVLKAVSPKWKTDPKTKARAKGVSVKLEGADFLDAEGEVLATFKQSVKKLMAVK